MSAFTPGPWSVSFHVEGYELANIGEMTVIRGGDQRWVGLATLDAVGADETTVETRTANARLIAAAPDMFGAGDEARAALYGCREVLGQIGNIQHAIDLLDAALAKADPNATQLSTEGGTSSSSASAQPSVQDDKLITDGQNQGDKESGE